MKNRLSTRALLHLSDRIRQARTNARMTKTELAERVGVCASAAVQWEHPKGTAPSVTNLMRIAQITEVAFEWLATGRGPSRFSADPSAGACASATTFFEERLLHVARRLPADQQEPLILYLEACAKDEG